MTTSWETVWCEAGWRCELRVGFRGVSHLFVYCGDVLASAESMPSGASCDLRAEVLRRRVLRGDLAVPSLD